MCLGNVVLLLAREEQVFIACDNIFILCGCSRISHGHEFIDTRFGNMSVNVNERGYIELYACIRATHFCLFFFF